MFIWLAYHNKILTRDNFGKRQQVNDGTCLFYGENETIHHLFFDCIVAKEIWKDFDDTFSFYWPHNMIELSVLWGLNNKKIRLLVLMPFGAF